MGIGGAIGGLMGGFTGLGQYAFAHGFSEYLNLGWNGKDFYSSWSVGYHTSDPIEVLTKLSSAIVRGLVWFSSTPEGALYVNMSSIFSISGAYLYTTIPAIGIGTSQWIYQQAQEGRKPPEFEFSQTFNLDNIL